MGKISVTIVKIQVYVFWVVMLHFQGEVKSPPWPWGQHGPLKWWYPTTILHSVTTQKRQYN